MGVPDILYFAEAPGAAYEALYLMPFMIITGGTFMTNDPDTLSKVKVWTKNSNMRVVSGGKDEMLSSSYTVAVYSNFYPCSESERHVLFMHGVADKRGIARPYTFKDQRNFLYKASMVLPSQAAYNPLSPRARAPFRWIRRLIKDRFDLILIPGRALYDLYKKAGAIRKGNNRIIGFPRFDPVFNGEIDRDEVLRELNLDPERKTILYAPTWHGKHEFDMNSMTLMGHSIVDAVDEDLNLIVKPHPRTLLLGEAESVVSRLREAHRESDNIRLVEDVFYDTVRLMAAADIMISDYSSVGIEFLALDRPILFADPLGDIYNDPNLAEIYVRSAGYVMRPGDDIRRLIDHALENPDEKKEERRKYADYFFSSRDGKAGERGARAIMELLT